MANETGDRCADGRHVGPFYEGVRACSLRREPKLNLPIVRYRCEACGELV